MNLELFLQCLLVFFGICTGYFYFLSLKKSRNKKEVKNEFFVPENVNLSSNRKFGVEIEFSHDVNLKDKFRNEFMSKFQNWEAKADGSIKPFGTEINSPILQGEEGLIELSKVLNWLKNNKNIEINDSCGLHVHIDVGDLTPLQVFTISERYSLHEDTFFNKIVKKHRVNNSYCLSARNNDIANANINIFNLEKHLLSLDNYRRSNFFDKYRTVNISCVNYGTAEFRQHHSTFDGEEITNWISFLVAFVESTKNKTPHLEKLDWFGDTKEQIKKAKVIKAKRRIFSSAITNPEKLADNPKCLNFVLKLLIENKTVVPKSEFSGLKIEEISRLVEDHYIKISIEHVDDDVVVQFAQEEDSEPVKESFSELQYLSTVKIDHCLDQIRKIITSSASSILLFDSVPENTSNYYYERLVEVNGN